MTSNSTEVVMSPTPRFVKVVCALGIVRHEDLDTAPDVMTQSGTVQIVCDAGSLQYLAMNGRGRLLDLEKEVFKVRKSDGELVDSHDQVGLYLIDPKAESISPKDFTYTAVIRSSNDTVWSVTFGGTTLLPDVVDLAKLVSSPRSLGQVTPVDQRASLILTRVEEMVDSTVVSGGVVDDDLILTRHDGTAFDAGNVRGPQGWSSYELATQHGYTGTEAQWTTALEDAIDSVATTTQNAQIASEAATEAREAAGLAAVQVSVSPNPKALRIAFPAWMSPRYHVLRLPIGV